MKGTQRLLAGLVLAIVASLVGTTLNAAPAAAADHKNTTSKVAAAAPSRGPTIAADNTDLTGPVTSLSEGGCGFLQRCVYLNQTDQSRVARMGVAAIAVFICTLGTAVCAVGAAVAVVLEDYYDDHGICSGGRKLEVRYFPGPRNPRCVG